MIKVLLFATAILSDFLTNRMKSGFAEDERRKRTTILLLTYYM